MRAARTALSVALTIAITLVSSACLEDPEGRKAFRCPNPDVFTLFVSPMIERRCGTLDCHGNDFRPMRIYGELGLRHPQPTPDGIYNRTGGNATTQFEAFENYRSICATEPEKIAEVEADPGGQSVNNLLLVRKARGQEGHKGGKVFNSFDDSDLCVVGWLRGDNPKAVRAACAKALENLPDNVELPQLE